MVRHSLASATQVLAQHRRILVTASSYFPTCPPAMPSPTDATASTVSAPLSLAALVPSGTNRAGAPLAETQTSGNGATPRDKRRRVQPELKATLTSLTVNNVSGGWSDQNQREWGHELMRRTAHAAGHAQEAHACCALVLWTA